MDTMIQTQCSPKARGDASMLGINPLILVQEAEQHSTLWHDLHADKSSLGFSTTRQEQKETIYWRLRSVAMQHEAWQGR